MTLRMLLELVLTTSLHLLGSSFSKLVGQDGEFDTCLSVVLYLVGLYKRAKLEVEARTDLICRHCGGVTGSNEVVFIGIGIGDVWANLFAAEDIGNVKVIEDLFCFICDDGEKDEVFSEITDSSEEETLSTVFFKRSELWSTHDNTVEIRMKIFR